MEGRKGGRKEGRNGRKRQSEHKIRDPNENGKVITIGREKQSEREGRE